MQAAAYETDSLPRHCDCRRSLGSLSDVAEPGSKDGKVDVDRHLFEGPLSAVGPSIRNSFYK
jgi:hypothetical protein